jgi:hypothetical protein
MFAMPFFSLIILLILGFLDAGILVGLYSRDPSVKMFFNLGFFDKCYNLYNNPGPAQRRFGWLRKVSANSVKLAGSHLGL